MSKNVYVIESRWAWDHSNTEFATLTVESPDSPLEELRPELLKSRLADVVRTQNGCPMADAKLVRLYRVIYARRGAWNFLEAGAPSVALNMGLQPLIEFDKNGEPSLLVHRHPDSDQTMIGTRLKAGDTIAPDDVYASTDGTWKAAVCPDLVVQDRKVVWIRPLKAPAMCLA